MREDQLVSERLRLKAHVLDNGEVCWGGDDIEAALREIADAGLVTLGFDILEPLSERKVKAWGTSAYEMDALLESTPWAECVALARDFAIKDIGNTQRLTRLKPPHSDVWYCVVSVDQLAAKKLKPGQITITPRFATITVSDPWEFLDENEGHIAFIGRIAGDANGRWLLRLNRSVVYKGRVWKFAIPTPRIIGQRDFGKPHSPANILFITDDQARDHTFLSAFDSQAVPATPWVIGSVELGIADIIPLGCDSYKEPRWTAPKNG